MANGWHEGRNPDAYFDTNYYLSHNPDVAAAGVNPLAQYDANGWHEGRNPSALFSTSGYLRAYPDVAAAGTDPLVHFLQTGMAEGRAARGTDTVRHDFNGDGIADILWRTGIGVTGLWTMNAGGASYAWRDLASVTSDWTIQGTADFNGDGRTDILLRNANTDVQIRYTNPDYGWEVASFDGWDYGDSWDPVVLDLDGSGIDITNRTDSTVYFDVDGDGYREQTAWAGPNDGLLVIDLAASRSFPRRKLITGAEGVHIICELIVRSGQILVLFTVARNNRLDV
jgi:hypothetical protein